MKKATCRLLVVAPMCKVLESYHSCLITRKTAEQTKQQWLFLDPSENWSHRANCNPESGKTGNYRESQPRSAFQEQEILKP